ncbi:unnamed protein product [Haemonchus placei]|uniref:Transposase n=1 Tax=Haemonchus placei TaxID=6290 RepID=A0A0N4X708_HAEPC|nr:unnamed protein product [Haemonchus placei]
MGKNRYHKVARLGRRIGSIESFDGQEPGAEDVLSQRPLVRAADPRPVACLEYRHIPLFPAQPVISAFI